jgi:hypothetical protein
MLYDFATRCGNFYDNSEMWLRIRCRRFAIHELNNSSDVTGCEYMHGTHYGYSSKCSRVNMVTSSRGGKLPHPGSEKRPISFLSNGRSSSQLNFFPVTIFNLMHIFSVFFLALFRRPPLWSSVQSFLLQIQRSVFDSRRYQIF